MAVPTTTQNNLRFKVNEKEYDLDKEMLDTEFNQALQKGVSEGTLNAEDLDKYHNSYTRWKDMAGKGQYALDRRGEGFGDMKYTGSAENAELGLNEEGQTAKPSYLRRKLNLGINTDKDDQTMAYINHIMGNAISKHSSNLDKQDLDAKTKVETEQKLAADEKLKKYKDPKFDYFSTTYQGRGDITRDQALKYHWNRLNDKQRGQSMNDYYAKVGSNIFDPNYDDENIRTSLKEKGFDVDAIRNEYKAAGWNEGKFGKDFKGWKQTSKVNQLLGTNIYDDPWFNKAVEAQAAGAAAGLPGAATGGTTAVNANVPAHEEGLTRDERGNPFTGIKDGKSYLSGKHNPNYIVQNPDGTRKFVAENKEFDEGGYKNYIMGLPQGDPRAKAANSLLEKLRRKQASMYGQGSPYVDINETTYPETGVNSKFAFNNIPGMQGRFTGKAANITGLFENVRKGNNYHVIEFATQGPSRLYTSKYMIIDRTGKKSLGNMTTNNLGEQIFTSQDGKQFNLGRKMQYAENAGFVKRDEFMPFSNASTLRRDVKLDNKQDEQEYAAKYIFKKGGTVKLQIGGSSSTFRRAAQNQQVTPHKATMGEAFTSGTTMSPADRAMLAGLVLDTGGLAASLTGVGSGVGAVLGAAGTTASLVSDVQRDGFQWEDAGGAALGYGMDIASAVPGLGIGVKTGKIAKTIRGAHKTLSALMIGAGAAGAANVVSKIAKGDDVTIEDWRTLASGLQAAVGGHRMIQNVAGTKKATSNFIEATIAGKKQRVPVDENTLASINSGKTDADKIELAKLHLSEQLGIKNPDEISLNQKLGLRLGINPLKKTETLKVGTEKGDVGLKNIDDYKGSGVKNWYMRNAVKSAAAQNPNAAGAKDIVGGNFTALGFLGHHSRMNTGNQKAGNAVLDAVNKMNISKGYFNKQGPHENLLPEQRLALPEGSGRKFNIDTDENAFKASDKAKQLALESEIGVDSNIGNKIGNERLIRSSARLSSVPVKESTRKGKLSQESNNRKAAESKVASDEKSKINENSKRLEKDKIEKIGRRKERESRLAKNQLSSKNKSKKFEEGGAIPLAQLGMKIPYINAKSYDESRDLGPLGINWINPKSNTVNQNSSVNKLSNKGINIDNSQYAPKYGFKTSQPAVDYMPNQTSATKAFSNNLGSQSQANAANLNKLGLYSKYNKNAVTGSFLPGKNVGDNNAVKGPGLLSRAGNFIKNNVDPIDLSELGRAASMSQLNKSIDTNVKAPVYEHMAETPMSIKGNMLAKYGADQAAANVISAAGRGAGADSKLNRMASQQAYGQASQIQAQGNLANADAIQKQEAMNTETQGRYAQNRNTIANQNIEGAAKAADATRELNNVKKQMVYQPYDELWKGINAKRQYANTVNKNATAGIRYNEMVEPVRQQMTNDNARYDALYTKYKNSDTPLSETEMSEMKDLENNLNNYKTKSENILYNLQINPKWSAGQGYWGVNKQPQAPAQMQTKGSIVRKKGGSLTLKESIEKVNSKISADYAKKIVNSSDRNYKDNVKQLKENIDDISHLRSLIFKKK